MLKQLTSKQVAEWQAYSSLEPFGSRHRDWHFGKIMSLMVQMFGSKQKFEPSDFVKPNRLDYIHQLKRQQFRQSGTAIKGFFKMLKNIKEEPIKKGGNQNG